MILHSMLIIMASLFLLGTMLSMDDFKEGLTVMVWSMILIVNVIGLITLL